MIVFLKNLNFLINVYDSRGFQREREFLLLEYLLFIT